MKPSAAPSEPEAPHVSLRLRVVGSVVGVLLFLAIAVLPGPLHRIPGYGDRPAYAAATAALMAALWFTEALPMAVTACLPLLLHPLLGVYGKGPGGDTAAAFSPFVDAYIFLFLGGMTIGAAMEEHGLHRRVALRILSFVGTEPKRLLLGVLVATAAVSLWISNTATAVMMLPIALALLTRLEESAGRRLGAFGAAVMLSVAWGSNIGGIGTKIGTGTNSIFLGFVSRSLHRDVGFIEYLAVGFPFVVLLLPIAWLVLWRFGRGDAPSGTTGRDVLAAELSRLGPMSRAERKVAAVFAGAAALWVTADLWRPSVAPLFARFVEKVQPKHGEASVAMLAAAALILLGVLPLRAIRRIPYGTLLLLGGSFAMAAGIDGSGLSKWIESELAGLSSLPLGTQVLAAAAASVFLTAVASNTATVSVLLNVLPRSLPVLTATALGASCDFMLPAGTPPNAIVFGSGRIRLPDMRRAGFLLDLIAVALVALWCTFGVVRLL